MGTTAPTSTPTITRLIIITPTGMDTGITTDMGTTTTLDTGMDLASPSG
jgi:hypothetical protein